MANKIISIPSCQKTGLVDGAIALFSEERTAEVAKSIKMLQSLILSGDIRDTIKDAVIEQAIMVGIKEEQGSNLADLIDDIIEDPLNISAIKKFSTETLRSVSYGSLVNLADTIFSVTQIAMDEARNVFDEVKETKERLDEQLDENESALEALKEGPSFNQLIVDIENVSSSFSNGIKIIEERFKDNPPTTPEDFLFLENQLEIMRGLACGELNEEAQKYVSSIAVYINMLASINKALGVFRVSVNSLNSIKANVCKLSNRAGAPTQSQVYKDSASAYLRILLVELNDINSQLSAAVNKQDPYATARVISEWCQKLSNLIALVNGIFESGPLVKDPVKELLLKTICDNLTDFGDLSISRLELEFGKLEQSFGLIALGVLTSISFKDFKQSTTDLFENITNLVDLMPSGQFTISDFINNALKLLDDSGLDVASSLLKIGDLDSMFDLTANNASLVSVASGCSVNILKDNPAAGRLVERVRGKLERLQNASAFGALNVTTLRNQAINNLEEEIDELKRIKELT